MRIGILISLLAASDVYCRVLPDQENVVAIGLEVPSGALVSENSSKERKNVHSQNILKYEFKFTNLASAMMAPNIVDSCIPDWNSSESSRVLSWSAFGQSVAASAGEHSAHQ